MKYILWFKDISIKNIPQVGGKNASLGEMYNNLSKKGVNIPNGFALTADFYWYYLKYNKFDILLRKLFKKLDEKNVDSLQKIGKTTRNLIRNGKIPPKLKKEILDYYKKLSKEYGEKFCDVAVRSSATAEDLPNYSFAGQHESYLNVKGEKNLFLAIKKCIASIFSDRAIIYRIKAGFDNLKIALSVGIQKMVRSDLGSSGVMFTLDTESGFSKIVLINSIYGLGELIVKGRVIPDTFYVFKETLKKGYRAIIRKDLGYKDIKYIYSKKGGVKKAKVSKEKQYQFSLTDDEILTLAKWAVKIEEHYSKKYGRWMPQDIEWAKDGITNKLFIVQSRPETVHQKRENVYLDYKLKVKEKPILTGIAIGDKIGSGPVKIIKKVSNINKFKKGEVLVTKMTDPDWVSIFPKAAAIITEEGGPTCHAAIVSREMGIPCIVGVRNVFKKIKNGQIVTVDCTQGRTGRIFAKRVAFKVKKINLKEIPKLKTKIEVNIGSPEIAFKTSFLPVDGVGLAREEFIIAEKIRVHPLLLYHFDEFKRNPEKTLKKFNSNIKISKLNKIIKKTELITIEHKDKKEYFVKELAEGIAQIASAFYPKEVIVRFSDFKTNEYKNLIGGEIFEKEEDNPMLGFRGASRYTDPIFQPAFLLECQAIKRVRSVFGLDNISVMIPFCRTIEEGKKSKELIKKSGLLNKKPGQKRLKVYVMCEIPSNVILANEFLNIFDGFSIGSNDLTQLTLGLDRDNGKIAKIADERNIAVKKEIESVIKICKRRKKYCGICGDAPSTFPKFAEFLVSLQIPAISLSPDAVIKIISKLKNKN